MSIPVVVLTGGPQSGKTSALDAIRQKFADKVVVIPEAATQGLKVNKKLSALFTCFFLYLSVRS